MTYFFTKMNFLKRKLTFNYRVIRSVVSHKLNKKHPVMASISPTSKCNLDCAHCSLTKRIPKKEFTVQEIINIIDQISELKIPFCAISGAGEPLLHKNILEIGNYIQERGMKSLLNTNGTLITKKLAKGLVRSYEIIIISLDGFEKTHDFIRGVKGSFKSTIKGIKNLNLAKGNNLIGLSFVISKYNHKDLIPLTRYLLKEKIVDFMVINPVSGARSRLLLPSTKESLQTIEELKKIKKRNPKFIRPTSEFLNKIPLYIAGKKFVCDGLVQFTITPTGDVLPCDWMDFPLGNIKNQTLKEILNSKKLNEFELRKKNCPGCLLECTIGISDIIKSNPLRMLKNFLIFVKNEYPLGLS